MTSYVHSFSDPGDGGVRVGDRVGGKDDHGPEIKVIDIPYVLREARNASDRAEVISSSSSSFSSPGLVRESDRESR